jgi:hypothetical protein
MDALLQLYTDALAQQEEAARAAKKAASQVRHDMRHMAAMVSFCVEKNEIEKLLLVADELDKKTRDADATATSHTGNALLDAALRRCTAQIQMAHLPELPTEKTRDLALALLSADATKINGRTQGKQYFLEIIATKKAAGSFAAFAKKYSATAHCEEAGGQWHIRLLF